MQVRDANVGDMDDILTMGGRFYATTSYRHAAAYDPDSVEPYVRQMIESGICLIAEHAGKAVGMVGLLVAPFVFNREHLSAHEMMWWVEPEARTTGAGIALLRAIRPAAQELGCVLVQMVRLADSPRVAEVLYLRQGYVPTESCYTLYLEAA